MTLVSTIYRRAPAEPMTRAEQDEAARRLWHAGSDMIALRLSEIRDDFERQAVVNAATRQFGARAKRTRQEAR